MEVKPYFKEDKEKVFDLFEAVYAKQISDDFWNWRFNNDFGKAIQYVMWDKNQIVGHYVVHPIPMKIGTTIDKALFSMAVMTHPNYRGKGVFTKLANTIYEKINETNYKLAIGFPNKNSYKIHFEKLGWENHGNILTYEKNVDNFCEQNINENIYTIKNLKKLDKKIDIIWHSFKNNYNLIVPRTQEYLNWRFINQPKFKHHNELLSSYEFYLIEKNGEPITYFVLKKYGKDKVHLVDHFGHINIEIKKMILAFSINFTKNENISYFSFWQKFSSQNNLFHKIFNDLKFSLRKSDEFFGIKFFDLSIRKILANKSSWYITMSDNDIY